MKKNGAAKKRSRLIMDVHLRLSDSENRLAKWIGSEARANCRTVAQQIRFTLSEAAGIKEEQ